MMRALAILGLISAPATAGLFVPPQVLSASPQMTDLQARVGALEAAPASVKSVGGSAPDTSGNVALPNAFTAATCAGCQMSNLTLTGTATLAGSALATAASIATALSPLATTASVTSAVTAATTGLATAASVSELARSIPAPGSAVPVETLGGSAGTATAAFMRADAKPARITRAVTVTTIAGGSFSGTWTGVTMSSAPTLVLTPIATGTSSIHCELTAAPTTTAFQGRCITLAVASLLAVGAGVQVQVIAIPPSQ